MADYTPIIKELEMKRVAFKNKPYPKPPTTRDITRWTELLRDDDSSLRQLSASRSSIRRRARELSSSIARELGKEVLFLVLSHLDQRKLSLLDKRTFTDALSKWWSKVQHPDVLAAVASKSLTLSGPERVDCASRGRGSAEPISAGQKALATFESAICDAAESIPEPEDRSAWLTTAYSHLHLLKRLSCIADNSRVNAKVAIMADIELMENYVGRRLYMAVQASLMRREEEGRLTKALPLYLARDTGEDFVLEIWMCSSHGRSFLEEERRMASIEGWKTILGDYLYEAMKTSKSRKIEEDMGDSKSEAIRLSFPDGDHYDSKLEVRINFDIGREIWSTGYP